MRSFTLLLIGVLLVLGGTAAAQPGAQPPPGLDGHLRLYVIPPAIPLNWTTPQTLIDTTINAQVFATTWEADGTVVSGHPIGHVYVEVRCKKTGFQPINIGITGMTSSEYPDEELLAGLGSLFEHYAGRFDAPGTARADVNSRKPLGWIAVMEFPLLWAECVHLDTYMRAYVGALAQLNYGSQFRPRGWTGYLNAPEGGGCATFGASFIDVLSLLPRSYMTNTWAREVVVGLSRIGGDPATTYPYGSNLIARHRGGLWAWPAATPIPKSGWIRPWGPWPIGSSPYLASWYTNAEWTATPKQVVPLTLYDPQLWFADIQRLHQAAWNGTANGWYATWDKSMPILVRKRGACPAVAGLKPIVDPIRDLSR